MSEAQDLQALREKFRNRTAGAVQVIERMTPAVLQAWCIDLAREIHEAETIATRYGFISVAQMEQAIERNPSIHALVEQERALWNSEENQPARLRSYAVHTLIESAAESARPLFDPGTPLGQRNDLMKIWASIAGVSGATSVSARGEASGAGTAPFQVNIVFTGSGRTETITTIEARASPGIAIADEEDGS